MFFGGGEICVEVFGPKGAQNGPKMKCLKFYEKSMRETFLIFCSENKKNTGHSK